MESAPSSAPVKPEPPPGVIAKPPAAPKPQRKPSEGMSRTAAVVWAVILTALAVGVIGSIPADDRAETYAPGGGPPVARALAGSAQFTLLGIVGAISVYLSNVLMKVRERVAALRTQYDAAKTAGKEEERTALAAQIERQWRSRWLVVPDALLLLLALALVRHIANAQYPEQAQEGHRTVWSQLPDVARGLAHPELTKLIVGLSVILLLALTAAHADQWVRSWSRWRAWRRKRMADTPRPTAVGSG